MNRYVMAFPFKGEYYFVYMTANQLANSVLPNTEDILDFKYENKDNDFNYRIYVKKDEYDVTFSHKNPHCFNVYYAYDEDGNESGTLAENDIPWLLVKIENENGGIIYSLGDYV